MNYLINKIPLGLAKEYIREHHYSRGSHNAPSPCYGLFDNNELIGVCMFANPVGERVKNQIFGEDEKNRVIELHRLHILDITPRNTESWFISRVLDLLLIDKPNIRCVIAFSDPTVGHNGTIYRATNAIFCGMTVKKTMYIDENGRMRHERQNSKRVFLSDALQMGWKPIKHKSKYRYIWIIGKNKADRKYWRNRLLLDVFPYPSIVGDVVPISIERMI